MDRLKRIFALTTTHSRITIALLLVVTLALGAGLPQLETGTEFQQFRGDSPEAAKLAYIEENFSSARGNATVAQIVVRDDDVLDRETLVLTLELQQELRENETVNRTLVDDEPTVGLANVVARAVIRYRNPNATDPTLDEQLAALQSMDESQVDRAVTAILAEERAGPQSRAFLFVSNEYEPGSDTANATVVMVFQAQDGPQITGQASDRIVASQSAMQALATENGASEEAFVVGNGVITAEQQQARKDSMRLVGPLALLFVFLTLVFAYRDAVDVLLGLLGIGLVLVWTFGVLGWVGIPFSSAFVAVPVLLIGLSIDFAIHVFMRYREERDAAEGTSVRDGMATALSSVGVALVLVTTTTAIGFLSNLVSPVGPLRDIGVISAVGIVSALFVFGALVPALKIEIDEALEGIGIDRAKSPIGTDGSRFTSVLSVGVRAASRAPVAVVVAVLLVSAGATVGATQVSTSFEPQDFFPGETPEWMEHLPDDLEPRNYTVKEHQQYASQHFVDQQSRAEILVEGDVTSPATLERIEDATAHAETQETTQLLSTGEAEVRTPLSVMERVAARNASFNETLAAADTDGDGVPDRNVAHVYDELFATAPAEAGTVLHRDDGTYRGARMTVAVADGASSQRVRTEMREVAAVAEGPRTTATATGDVVVRSLVQDSLLSTLVRGLVVTLLAILLLLMVVYRVAYGSATLGLVTILPVVFTVSWIVGTMTLLGIPLSVLTALVASLTIGIGVDYCLHLSERYVDELQRGKAPVPALTDSIAGTGSALFGSAVTTMGGFGVLALAVLPALGQFGTITALTIAYSFVAAIVVLPSLLVLWTRYVRGTDVTLAQLTPAGPVASREDD